MLNKLIVITAIVFLGISCAIGNSDGNKGKGDGNNGNRHGNMGSGGDYLNPYLISSGYYPNFPWYTTGGTFYNQAVPVTTFSPLISGIATTPIASMPSQAATIGGDTPVTIQSQGMRGYQVFLDETYIGTEGMGGDLLDGKFSFSVTGNQNHAIRVYDGQFNYPKSMYFARGVLKIINVEPGTAVYI